MSSHLFRLLAFLCAAALLLPSCQGVSGIVTARSEPGSGVSITEVRSHGLGKHKLPDCREVFPPSAKDSSVGTFETSLIDAKNKCNDTGIKVLSGIRYCVEIVPGGQDIVDGNGKSGIKLAGLEGWDCPMLWPLAFFKREPFQPYFALIGVVNGKYAGRLQEFNPARPDATVYVAPQSGRLYCYFNDWPCRYCNNHGLFRLRFTRMPPINFLPH